MVVMGPENEGDWDILGPSTALRINMTDGSDGLVLVLGPTKIEAKVGIPIPQRGKSAKRHVELVQGQLCILKGDLLIEAPEEELLKLESDLCVPVSGTFCEVKGEVSREWIQTLIKKNLNLGMSPEKYLSLLREIRRTKGKNKAKKVEKN